MLVQSVKKEAIIIGNDLHSLAVLILLPITFMIIMTLAMGEQQSNLVKKINIALTCEVKCDGEQLSALAQYMKSSGVSVNNTNEKFDASLVMQAGFSENLLMRQGLGKVVLDYSAQLSPQTRSMVLALIKESLSKLKLHAYMEDIGDFDEALSLAEKVHLVNNSASVDYLLLQGEQQQIFSAPTLYSIPSWLIFGLYFIVLPISTTLIKEKENGTLLRIQTYPISNHYYFFNKALSYSVVSVFQWILLSVVGLLCVPWLTEQAVLVIQNPSLYLISGFFIIFAAIGFAFLLASLVNTFEQAIVLGGGINILLAALSGFMVPIDIMPQALANIATFSPMYWSSELLKQGLSGATLMQATTNLLLLTSFGSTCFIGALIIFNYKTKRLSWT
ncbi:MAG: ABC transporter permease [Alteromonadales bacterium]|nr:ABC transporter permease [Alteromonadales bacterium]